MIQDAGIDERNDATPATRRAHEAVAATLPPEDARDFERARRGFLGTIPDAEVPASWSMAPFAFLDGERPATVNPSLWRQAKLNAIHGLFEVTPGIYQVRGFDISNVTFIEGKRGYIVVDPLRTAAVAAAALRLVRETLGDRPVTAVIYTHSHGDHFGGIRGIVPDDAHADGVEIVAPEGFLKAAVSETMLIGNVGGRRTQWMYGLRLPYDARGHVDSGLGKGLSRGPEDMLAPTTSITGTGQTLTLDGVEIVFQLTPGTEAPAEMNFAFPQLRALCMAENCSAQLHNLYTLRGAEVRDARAWSRYLDEALRLWGRSSDVLFTSHHWPRWGAEEVADFLRDQRDLYKYIHDQTVRLACHGWTPLEIAEELRLPPALEAQWYTRGYYGTLNHNVKAVYQKYLGWFDGNPANLHRLPPQQLGRKYVELAGGPDALLAAARAAFDAGEYRWGAELLNHLVFAQPDNAEGRRLQADTFEQLGYQAESGPWRDIYLTGAAELRNPIPVSAEPRQLPSNPLRGIPADALLETLAVRVNAPRAATAVIRLTIGFRDTGERYNLTLENAVLHHWTGEEFAPVETTRDTLIDLVHGEVAFAAALAGGAVDGPGAQSLRALLDLLDRFDFPFPIVTP